MIVAIEHVETARHRGNDLMLNMDDLEPRLRIYGKPLYFTPVPA